MTEEKNTAGPFPGNNPPSGGISDGSGSLDTGEGEVPLSTRSDPKVNMRTMQSDIQSISEAGGSAPKPYTPSPSRQKDTQSQKSGGQQSFVPPGVTQDYTPTVGQPPSPPSPGGTAMNSTPKEPSQKKSGNGFWIIVSIIVFIGLVAAGYFFVYPIISDTITEDGAQEESAVMTEENQEEATERAQEETPAVEEEPIQPTEDEQEAGQPPATPIATNEVHASFFRNPADLVLDVSISSLSGDTLLSQIQYSTTSVPLLKEIVFKTQENKPISFHSTAQTLFPDFFTNEFVKNFSPDATIFTYTNAQGTWLGIVTKLAAGVEIGPVQDAMSKLQKSSYLSRAFLLDPGAIGEWRDGEVKHKPTSLVPFEKQDAVFSYTWFNTYLLISTNLNGAGEAAARLGF